MAGIDGCPGGWVVATVPVTVDGGLVLAEVCVVADLGAVVAALESGRLTAAAIDIPIGLPASAPRACDIEARRLLGPRRSSVFPSPVRSVLKATTYAEACAASRAATGKALSKQTFNIVAKIREVDDVVSPRLQDRLFEMCPELSLAELAGGPMAHNKRTAEGRTERIDALGSVYVDVTAWLEPPPHGAARDDVLDALAGAWTALRYVAGTHRRLGGREIDATGLRMEVIA